MSSTLTVILSKRLHELRLRMLEHRVSAYIIPHQDAHNSEYISAADERIAFISGFDGSAGTCVVTQNDALLWTDGRYFKQAEKQLPDYWTLMRDRVPGTPRINEWIKQNVNGNETNESKAVGIDASLTPVSAYNELISNNIKVECIETNLVDLVWGKEKPLRSMAGVMDLPIKYSGQSRLDKIQSVCEKMTTEKATYLVVSSLDDIAWLLNLRGSDIDYNPVFFSYCVIHNTTKPACYLFIDEYKINASLKETLTNEGIRIKRYDEVIQFIVSLTAFGECCSQDHSKVDTGSPNPVWWLDPSNTNLSVYRAVTGLTPAAAATNTTPKVATTLEKPIPTLLMKAKKNQVELEGFRQSHIRDGAAKTLWMHWLFTEVVGAANGSYRHHNEVTLANKLEDFRKSMDHYLGLSFPSISSFGKNAAIIHYHAKSDDCSEMDLTQMYLIDSGATYLDGTTDVTRTIHFGNNPTRNEIMAFTNVLKGLIALTLTKFPPGITNGPWLDVIARYALWQNGLDYRHGTGHGVGHCLCVHEGPQGISPPTVRSTNAIQTILEPGMILSNEPGYYEDNVFGVRIENLMAVVESNDTVYSLNRSQKMLTFETLTMIPIQKSLIDVSLLSRIEIEWIDEYHKRVLENIVPYFQSVDMMKWLTEQCSPLEKTKH